MKKILLFLLFLMIIFSSSGINAAPQKDIQIIDKIKILPDDIPQGFIYATLPEVPDNNYKKTIKTNPSLLDAAAIKKLTGMIYPGGDFNEISSIHLTILAKKETPHRDDIVCYIIRYNNSQLSKDEIKKLSEYAKFNQDRAILHVKDNTAVFLFVDDINNFQILQNLDNKIKERLEKN